MTHQCIVTLLRLDDGGCLQVILIESMHNLIQVRDILVETGQVNITAFLAVAIGVERVRAPVFVVCEDSEILAPVPKRGGCIHECVGSSNGFGSGETLEQEPVSGVIGVPPHLELLVGIFSGKPVEGTNVILL